MLTLIALIPTSLAGDFGQVSLVEGAPEFTSCIASDKDVEGTCAWKFYHFLGDSMTSQGLTFSGPNAQLSAALQTEAGWILGARLDSFPVGPPPENLSGKAENTQFSPVLPRLFAGKVWQGDHPASVGLSALPPIPVGGASALVLGVEGGLAWQLGATRLGAGLDVGFTSAHAPITASQEQFDDRENFDNPDNLDPDTYEAVCGASENGCLDTFQQLTVGASALGGWQLGPVRPYARADLRFVSSSLTVMYDGTRWALHALQPGVGAGLGLPLVQRLFLQIGVSRPWTERRRRCGPAVEARRLGQLAALSPPGERRGLHGRAEVGTRLA